MSDQYNSPFHTAVYPGGTVEAAVIAEGFAPEHVVVFEHFAPSGSRVVCTLLGADPVHLDDARVIVDATARARFTDDEWAAATDAEAGGSDA